MMTTVLTIAFIILALSIACALLRLGLGPTAVDRIMAFDLIATATVGMIVLLAIQWKTAMYLDMILVYTLLGFCGTVTFVHYLSRTHELEKQAAPPSSDASRPESVDHDD